MSRYADEYYWRSYRGFSLRPEPVRGDSLDPNYHGGEYRGMRMRQGYAEQAPYGLQRIDSADDLGGFGGYEGIEHREWRLHPDTGTYEPVRGHARDYDRGYRDLPVWHGHEVPLSGRRHGRDRWVEDGGVPWDRSYLRDYNTNSPALRGWPPYDRDPGDRPPRRRR